MSKHREGWSWGTSEGKREWLTILGSHWSAPTLHASVEEANAAKPEALNAEWNADRATLAYVREVYHSGVESGRAYYVLKLDTAGPGDPVTEECSHSPVAGMMHVHPEDLDAVAQMRANRELSPVECEDCDQVYRVGKGWTS